MIFLFRTIFKIKGVKEIKLGKTPVSYDMGSFNFSSDFQRGFKKIIPYEKYNKRNTSFL